MVRKKTKPIILMLLIMLGGIGLKAQNVYFTSTNGTNGTYGLNDVRSITFSDTILNLDLKDGTTYHWSIDSIRSLKYIEATGINELIGGLNSLDLKLSPNPNNGSFQLRYRLPKQTNVQISLYATDGKLIKTLFMGHQTSGEQQVNANINELPQGIYICHVETEGLTVNKKMIVN